ncbi:Capsule assembly protein Wzi [Filimonas lacunae]|uniref:Capsule assembly protein Wzi n=2 Tax=Filimonas lacunae TaxID=477680 RepID=A0A1N7L130_9BACT|nr:Capsule assembly protein Wzi [Filimonas lacunae]
MVLCLLCTAQATAQLDSLQGYVSTRAFGAYKKQVPFWMRSAVYGNKPSPDGVVDMTVGVYKPYQLDKEFNWSAGMEVQGSVKAVTVIEAFAKLKWRNWEIAAGRMKDMVGLADSSLSSGSFSVSGNALGIPQVKIGLSDYTPLPVLNQWIAVKASLSYGWIGRVPVQNIDRQPNVNDAQTYFHAGSFYARIGKPDARLQFYIGANHEVMWGDEKRIYGSIFPLSPAKTFLYAVLGKTYGSVQDTSFAKSKVGNQLGSVDVGMEYKGDRYAVFLYRQNIYDVGALARLANIMDGLNGIRIINLQEARRALHIHKMVFELLYTKNQAGGLKARYVKSGDENYYNNYVYTQGWSYKGAAIGNPFITLRSDGRASLSAGDERDYFVNNRVLALYAGIQGNYKDIGFTGKIALSKNWGTYGSSPEGHSTGPYRYPPPPSLYFHEKNQVSLYGSFDKAIGKGFMLDLAGALDTGSLLYYNVAVALTLRKVFK